MKRRMIVFGNTVFRSVMRIAFILAFLFLVLFIVLGIGFWYYSRDAYNYSDDELYSFANEYIIQKVGVEQFNANIVSVLTSCSTNDTCRSRSNVGPESYWPPEGSSLDKMAREFPSMPLCWELMKYEGHKAMVMRFGDHSNYAWLVAVDPSEHIRFEGDKVRRIADNIAVVHDFAKILNAEEENEDFQPEKVQ